VKWQRRRKFAFASRFPLFSRRGAFFVTLAGYARQKGLYSGRRLVYNSAMRNNSTIVRLTVLVVLILVITAMHYLTGIQKVQFHDIYRRL
jgi:hypothetical protein